jgi:hypothetical protein
VTSRDVKHPSLDVSFVDHAVNHHLMSRINDLWPRPGHEGEQNDRAEALRNDLRLAITQVLADRNVVLVTDPSTDAAGECRDSLERGMSLEKP